MAASSSTSSSSKAAAVTSAPPNDFVLHLSLRFILGTLVIVAILAFGVGQLAVTLFAAQSFGTVGAGGNDNVVNNSKSKAALPSPFYASNKDVPRTVYTSKHYDTGAIATSDTILARRAEFREERTVGVDGTSKDAGSSSNDNKSGADTNSTSGNDTNEEQHEPAGQHLLIDIKSVEGTFLNSEDRLARAMVDLIEMSGLTMLSYHCHGLEPVGVSCVGVLLESHISFHTWPIPGVITLDLFTCGPGSLLPLLPDIARLFGVPRWQAVPGDVVERPHVQWAHKKRGFAEEENNLEPDMDHYMLGWLEFDMKELVVSEQTEFQRVDVFKIINPRFNGLESYKKSLANDGSYEAENPKLFEPDRVIYLDGITQSRLHGEAAYHEALVHPAMFAHPNPRRVAIIGGGEGATLREVLKHRTVETATMVEIDEGMVNLSRKYIPEWSDCSNLVGSAASCFDDPRSDVHYTDAIAWFLERFLDEDAIDPAMRYDVIIMDALDPSSVVEFSDILYDNESLMRAMSNALGDNGIFIAQIGEDERHGDPGQTFSTSISDLIFINHLGNQGFVTAQNYVEAHGGFLGVWQFLAAFKNKETNTEWHLDQASVDLKIQSRAMKTVDGSPTPFRYFDGASMMTYQYPSRVYEDVVCHNIPQPPECAEGHGFEPHRPNADVTAFEVKPSTVAKAGRGVFATRDIEAGSYLALEEGVNNMVFMPTTTSVIEEFRDANVLDCWKVMDVYMNGYGFESDYYGNTCFGVDPGILTFMNHGCNGSDNLVGRIPITVTEQTADPANMAPELETSAWETAFYSPYYRRNHMLHQNAGDFFSRDVKAGEEIFTNYLGFVNGEGDEWSKTVLSLREQCGEGGTGRVSEYESATS